MTRPVLLAVTPLLSGLVAYALPTGVEILGDVSTGTAPAVSFAGGIDPSAAATTVTAGGGTLQVLRGSAVEMTLNRQASQLPSVQIGGELLSEDFAVRGASQWSLWDLDTFDAPADSGQWVLGGAAPPAPSAASPGLGPGPGPAPPPVSTVVAAAKGFCGTPRDQFLGGHCQFAATAATRRYVALPAHSQLRVTARVHFLDQWKGESVVLLADGRPIWAESHDWCPNFLSWMCSKYGIDTCGRDTPDRLSVRAEATIAHVTPTVELTFASTLDHSTDPCYISWGVDDVAIELI